MLIKVNLATDYNVKATYNLMLQPDYFSVSLE